MPRRRKYARKITKLEWVEALPSKPPFIPTPRLKGSRRQGILYEGRVANKLQTLWGDKVHHGQWFSYKTKDKIGYAQTDILVDLDPLLLLIECKLTSTEYAISQLKNRYLPIVSLAYPKHTIRAIQICRHFSFHFNGPTIETLDDALTDDVQWSFITLKWRL